MYLIQCSYGGRPTKKTEILDITAIYIDRVEGSVRTGIKLVKGKLDEWSHQVHAGKLVYAWMVSTKMMVRKVQGGDLDKLVN